MRFIAAVALAAILAPSAAFAAAPDRYEITPAEGGFLRLDRETGATAFCSLSGEGYACRPATEKDRAAGTGGLEKRLAAIEERLSRIEAGKPPAKPDAAAKESTLDLPTDEQMDRVTSFIERALKRLRELAETMQKSDETGQDRQRL